MKTRSLSGLLLGVILSLSPVLSAQAADEAQVQALAARREALVRDGKVNLPEMSQTLRTAINEGERLVQANDPAGAESKLQELSKYGPVEELPSFDLLMLESYLALKRGDTAKQATLRGRAEAMRDLLYNRSGAGTQSDPVRVIMVNEITEWVRSRLGQIRESKPMVVEGRSLQAVTYSGPDSGNQPRQVFFFIDPRYMAQVRPPSLFTTLPQMTPRMLELTADAKARRDRFLDDMSIPYLTLQKAVSDQLKRANELASAGKPAEALAALREIETIRPIEEIPSPTLLISYSTLLGQTGDSARQTQIRDLAFGTFQAIAASGDALTPETAIEVLFVEEEYAWLRDKHLAFLRQSLVPSPARVMDVMHAKDVQGNERDYYFDITRLSRKEKRSIENHE